MRVAFIGLGLMGGRMAANLVSKGFAVTVWNRSPAKAEPDREGSPVVRDAARGGFQRRGRVHLRGRSEGDA